MYRYLKLKEKERGIGDWVTFTGAREETLDVFDGLSRSKIGGRTLILLESFTFRLTP